MFSKFIKLFFHVYEENCKLVVRVFGLKITLKLPPSGSLNTEFNAIHKFLNDIEYKQDIISNYYMDITKAKQAKGNLREFQLKDVELLKKFVSVCEKRKLTYWLDFGSLLGAVRHKGFIPWDDNIDVSMSDADFIRFKSIVKEEFGENIELIPVEENKMERLTVTDDKQQPYLNIYAYKEENEISINCNMPFANRFAYYPVRKDLIFPLEKISFENITVSCPFETDAYLRVRYGNYMLFPAKNEQSYLGEYKKVSKYFDYYDDNIVRN